MPGPSTEVLNDDIKELKALSQGLREDLHKVEVAIREEIHRVDNGLAELRIEVKDAIGIGKWVATLLVSLLITGGAGGLITGVWWASRITSKVEALDVSIANSIAKALEQSRPPAPRPEMLDQVKPAAPKPGP